MFKIMLQNWCSDIQFFLESGDLSCIIDHYEVEIEKNPQALNSYWYLGLAYLLCNDIEAAQFTWSIPIAHSCDSETDSLKEELCRVLLAEACRQFDTGNEHQCIKIRQQIREILPSNIINILELILLEIKLDLFIPLKIYEWDICSLLKQNESSQIDTELVFNVLKQILNYPHRSSFDFAEVSLKYVTYKDRWADLLVNSGTNLGYYFNAPLLGIDLLKLCLQYIPKYLRAIEHLPRLYLEAGQYQEAIKAATIFHEISSTPELKYVSNALLLKSMLSAGAWKDLFNVAQRHKTLLQEIITEQPDLSLSGIQSLVVFTGQLFYIQDNVKENRWYLNEAAKLFSKNVAKNSSVKLPLYRNNQKTSGSKLRIGYIAHTLKTHSVGWLSRWLFQYLNRNEFETYLYLFVQSQAEPFFQEWFMKKADKASFFIDDIPAAAEQIRDDNVDILIDLDSITLDHTISVMSLKPAPVQATWLGWDASGLPTIDYYIADPYVLPAGSERYYQEKILRLPQTYIAVDGFELDVPTIRRRDLEIPSDSVIYFSSQVGMKRHPETIMLQLQIIKEVPNSFFLIKGLADSHSIQEMFLELAAQVGVQANRLKFLPMVSTEMEHRANLGIADVILDTFPYNGATTTLETLWLGIPLVTRVGTQFAARNSYSFLMNVGVTEGIAWTSEEYVEWGIRFGYDFQLRQDISWKLRRARRTSSLWNTKRFAKDMEQAYRDMWDCFVKQK